jgi:hypothetical protein
MMSAIQVTDTSKRPVLFDIEKIDDALYSIKIQQKLIPSYDYLIKTNAKELLDAAGNFRDTTFITKFTTYNSVNYTGLSGVITGASADYILVLEEVDKPELKYKTGIDSTGKFEFTDVLPGKYKLWTFQDLKGKKEFYFGSLFPYEHSAKFLYYPSKIELIARWVTFDFKWNLNK